MSASAQKNCAACRDGKPLAFNITVALQPIVHPASQTVWAQEALVRGPGGEPAGWVFAQIDSANMYQFDQACRIEAIRQAAQCGVDSLLSINFMPNAVYQPELCIRTTLAAAREHNFPIDKIMFEVTEGEEVDDFDHLHNIITSYKNMGFITAIDDFGAGYSGLNMLAELDADVIKLDMALIRDIHQHRKRQAIVKGIVQVCHELGIKVIAEGVEQVEEYHHLQNIGIEYFQGYLFARPCWQSLAQINWP
ncbi:MAG: diguanylate phosphodiesterase [Oceanospirillaceae bacterium]|nr:diguanylate phosphodiesterase [Oceanospirillaceae bacterium]MBT12705.1 diguanylate phosphodiesterase [Oceanospirillaceae bacterium]